MSNQAFQQERHSVYDGEPLPDIENPQTAVVLSTEGIQHDQDLYNEAVFDWEAFNQQDPNIDPFLPQHNANQLTSHSTASSSYPPLPTSGATTTAITPYFSSTSATGISDLQLSDQVSDAELKPDTSFGSRRASKRAMSQQDYDARHAQGASWSSSQQNVNRQAAPVAPMLPNVSHPNLQVTRRDLDVTSSLIPQQNRLILPQTHQRHDLSSELSATTNNPFDMSNNLVPYQEGGGQHYLPSFSQQIRGGQQVSQQLNPLAQNFNAQHMRQPQIPAPANPPQQYQTLVFPSGHIAFQAVARLAGSAFSLPVQQNSTEPFLGGLFAPWEGVYDDPELPAIRDNPVPPTPPRRSTDRGDKYLCGNPHCSKNTPKGSQADLCTTCAHKRKLEKRGPTVVNFDPEMTYAQAVDNVFSFRGRHDQPQYSDEMVEDFREHTTPGARQEWASYLLRMINTESVLTAPGFEDAHSKLLGEARVKSQAGYDLKFVQQTPQYNHRMINSRILLLLEAAIQYQAGNARTVYDDGGDNIGYSAQTTWKLSERLWRISEILRDEKKIVLDVIEGRGVNAFVRDPNGYLKRKVDNISSNDRKRQAKEDADGGPPKSGGSRKTQNARSKQAIERQQEKARRDGVKESMVIPKVPGRKRRGRSDSASTQHRQSSEPMQSPEPSDASMAGYGDPGHSGSASYNAFSAPYPGYQAGGDGRLDSEKPYQLQHDYSMNSIMGMPPDLQAGFTLESDRPYQLQHDYSMNSMLGMPQDLQAGFTPMDTLAPSTRRAVQHNAALPNMAQTANPQRPMQRLNDEPWVGFSEIARKQETGDLNFIDQQSKDQHPGDLGHTGQFPHQG